MNIKATELNNVLISSCLQKIKTAARVIRGGVGQFLFQCQAMLQWYKMKRVHLRGFLCSRGMISFPDRVIEYRQKLQPLYLYIFIPCTAMRTQYHQRAIDLHAASSETP